MANLMKKNGGQNEMQTSQWDPWRAMRDLLRWDPFREMAPAAAAFDRSTFAPTFDVTENKDAYVFKADVPGVKQDELEITTTGNRIQISGKRDVEQENTSDTVYTYERQYGSFSRTFTLPDGADIANAKSKLEAGVLTLVVPKHETAQTKKIEVKAGAPKS
ncbi:MAG TPA: Hsp20/alpha crystallin family protein [Kofleriaceae bacterium]|jgi:HSP20 family protein